jgi:DNA-binding Lrp family transcriptional regulator
MLRGTERSRRQDMDKLLTLLKKNALESPRNLARMLNKTEKQIKDKIAKYEKEGVIRGYQAIVNEDQLDLNHVSAVIEVKITPERAGGFDRVAARIGRFSEVKSLFLMSGTYDLLVFVTGRNLKNVASFVSVKLATIEGVVSTSTHFMLKTYKEQGVLMEPPEKPERLKVSA